MRPSLMLPSALLGLLVYVPRAYAEEPVAPAPERHPTTVLVETDPTTFVFSGYAAHLRASPAGSGWAFGGGVYGMKIPTPIAELDARNRGAGFTLDLRNAYA